MKSISKVGVLAVVVLLSIFSASLGGYFGYRHGHETGKRTGTAETAFYDSENVIVHLILAARNEPLDPSKSANARNYLLWGATQKLQLAIDSGLIDPSIIERSNPNGALKAVAEEHLKNPEAINILDDDDWRRHNKADLLSIFARHKPAEQDGGGQPVTRPESK